MNLRNPFLGYGWQWHFVPMVDFQGLFFLILDLENEHHMTFISVYLLSQLIHFVLSLPK